MKHIQRTYCAVQAAIIAGLGLGLAGCGGGGSDSAPPPPPPASINLTAANRDVVAHATAGGILGLSPGQMMPLTGTGAATDRSAAQSPAALRPSVWLARVLPKVLQPARAGILSTGRHQAHPLDVIGPIEEACFISGTLSTTMNVADVSVVSEGDMLTLVYRDCMDFAGETLNGTVEATFFQIGDGTGKARMVMNDYADVAERHAMTLDGSMLLDYSFAGSVEITRLTAEGRVVATVSNHIPFKDTVTLSNGFFEELTYDSSILPPPGTTGVGRSSSVIGGTLESKAAGGMVEVSTLSDAPLTQYGDQLYPTAGVVMIKGKTGTLLVSALSTKSVQLSLDTNDDGTPESSENVEWDWLF